jgi:hypothetical protein
VLAQVKAPEHLDFHFADADLRVRAPQSVLAVLDQMFARIPREWSGAKPAIALDVIFDGVWHIAGSALSATKVLGAASSLPQVSGACVSSLLAELAANASISIWRAAIVEFEGNALALVGDDWETAITLAAHLHARGWRIVSGDYGVTISKATARELIERRVISACVSGCGRSITLVFIGPRHRVLRDRSDARKRPGRVGREFPASLHT